LKRKTHVLPRQSYVDRQSGVLSRLRRVEREVGQIGSTVVFLTVRSGKVDCTRETPGI
jgi:hypothetical protein